MKWTLAEADSGSEKTINSDAEKVEKPIPSGLVARL
jgi:hypothetical protein